MDLEKIFANDATVEGLISKTNKQTSISYNLIPKEQANQKICRRSK